MGATYNQSSTFVIAYIILLLLFVLSSQHFV